MKILSDLIFALLLVDIIITGSESLRVKDDQNDPIVAEETYEDSDLLEYEEDSDLQEYEDSDLLEYEDSDLLEYEQVCSENATIYDYHQSIGIPEAERILNYETNTRRVIRGHPSYLGDQPYQGGLIISLKGGYRSTCGCSLLSKVRALTAAHCWRQGDSQAHKFTVVLGSTTLFSGGVRRQTTEVITHEEYNDATIENDIAMIKISSVDFNNYIKPIALPSGEELDNDWTNYKAIISGFGQTENYTSYNLEHASINIISNEHCQKRYEGIQYLKGGSAKIKDSHICISGRDGEGPCRGDSGGPLAVFTRKWVLVGVTSAAVVCGDNCPPYYPAIYTRVSAYNDWIQKLMAAM